jgi:predicted RNase H-like HicB family nuclease
MLLQWSDEDQGYLLTLLEWADLVLGPVTHGSTCEESIRNSHEALEALIASARQHQEPRLEPRLIVGV